MTRDQVITKAIASGMYAKACADDNYIAIECGKAEDPNERMRMTSDGALLLVDDGYYWQLATAEELSKHLEEVVCE